MPGQEVKIYAEISRILNMTALNYMTQGTKDDLREAEELLQQARWPVGGTLIVECVAGCRHDSAGGG